MVFKLSNYYHWAPVFLRFGLGFIFLWSAISKLVVNTDAIGVCTNVEEAVTLVGSFDWLPISPELFVTIQSWAELILGIMLVVGIGMQFASVATVLLLASFFVFLDFDLIWKNVAILGAAVALMLSPADRFCLDNYMVRKKINSQ